MIFYGDFLPGLLSILRGWINPPEAYKEEPKKEQAPSATWEPPWRIGLTQEQREWQAIKGQVLVRDQWQCRECGCSLSGRRAERHVHHVIPRAAGGTNDLGNLVLLCRRCHSSERSAGHSLFRRQPSPDLAIWLKTGPIGTFRCQRARKPHACRACHREITPGIIYWRSYADVEKMALCAECVAGHGWRRAPRD